MKKWFKRFKEMRREYLMKDMGKEEREQIKAYVKGNRKAMGGWLSEAGYELCMETEECPYKPPTFKVYLRAVRLMFDFAIYPVEARWCWLVGHSLIEEGFANPDSGYMGLTCTRCGWHKGSYLY